MEVRLGALKLYRKHLVDQYADRCAWWSLKDISGESMSRTMTIITDGADQASHSLFLGDALGTGSLCWVWVPCFGNGFFMVLCFFSEAKYQIPRDPSLRACYRSSKLARPKLKIHGAWCFGFNLQLAVLEENTTHGSALVVELLMITIEQVMEHCRLKSIPCPDTLCIVGDNTVKELKNSICMGYVSNLINHSKLRSPAI